MDEMRVGSKFLCGIIARLVQRVVKKCCGVKTKISLDRISYTYNENGTVNIHIKEFDATMSAKDFEKLLLGKLGDDGE